MLLAVSLFKGLESVVDARVHPDDLGADSQVFQKVDFKLRHYQPLALVKRLFLIFFQRLAGMQELMGGLAIIRWKCCDLVNLRNTGDIPLIIEGG